MTIAISGTTGITLAGQFDSASTFGFKNRIINGGMVIDQRNAGAAVTLTNAASTFPVDRFYFYKDNSSAVVTGQQSSTAPTGFNNSLFVSVTTGAASSAAQELVMFHSVEGFNVSDFGFGTASASVITLSFWVRSSLTGTFGGAIASFAATRSYIFTYTINAANTWEQKTITIAGDTSGTWLKNNSTGLSVKLDIGSGSNYNGTAGSWTTGNVYSVAGATKVMATTGATFYITGVQLEKGSTATSFDFRSYGTELSLCQRYYQQGNIIGRAYIIGSNYYWSPFSVVMRVSPTMSVVSPSYSSASAATFGQITSNGAEYAFTASALGGYAAATFNSTSEL
jgi:hypothetical protein